MKNLDRLNSVLIVCSLITATLFLSGCTKENKNNKDINDLMPVDDPVIPERGYFLGTLPIPAEGESVKNSYKFFSNYGEFTPVWGRPTPFYQLSDDLSGNWGDTYIGDYIRGNGMFPIVQLSFIGKGMNLESPPDISNPSLRNNEWRESYKKAAVDVVRACKPLYLSLGNEVNRWYEKYEAKAGDKNGFQHYVSLYEETYDAVKDISPECKVFCVFAREIVSENRMADFTFLEMFDNEILDLFMITSYPHSVKSINKPSDIQDDYYSSIAELLPDKRFGFSECSWPSSEPFGGEKGQSDFLKEITENLTLKRNVNLKFLCWSWLHDLNEGDHTGMIKRDGTQKEVFEVWKSLT